MDLKKLRARVRLALAQQFRLTGVQYSQQYFARLIHNLSNCTTAFLYWWHFQSNVSLTNVNQNDFSYDLL